MGHGYPPILAVDFDGTIKKSGELNDYDSELNEGCKEVLIELKKRGCKLILWTCRDGEYLEKAKEYLAKHGILHLFDAFNENTQEAFTTSNKIYADYYIDDLTLEGFPGWSYACGIVFQDPYFNDNEIHEEYTIIRED